MQQRIIYRFCRANFKPRILLTRGEVMNLHLLAGIAVLLILVAASAYREALRNEPIRRFRMNPGKLPQLDENE
jgi:hypothetical protein